MNKNTLTKSVLAMLLLSSSLAIAETEYPATNFEPTVLFHDEDANSKAKANKPNTASASQEASSTSQEAAKPASSASTTSAAKIESKSASSATSATTSAPASSSASSSTAEGDSNLVSIFLGLIAAGAVGFFLKNQARVSNRDSGSASNESGFKPDSSGLSGVARYLKNIEAAKGTGVARYIDKQKAIDEAKAAAAAEAAKIAAESTGVAKYIKQNANAPKKAEAAVVTQASDDGETGVARYLRNRS